MKLTKTLILILILAFLLRFQPIFLTGYSDPDSFFHERNIETIVSGHSAFFWDSLSQQGRYYSNFPLFHLAFAIPEILTGLPTNFLLVLLPSLFGVALCAIVFFLVKHYFNPQIALFAAFSLAIMPLNIIRTNGVARPDAFGMLFLLACVFFVLSKKTKTALALAFCLALTNPIPSSAMLTGILFFASLFLFAKKQQSYFGICFGIAIVSVLGFLLWSLHYPFGPLGYFSNASLEAQELQHTDIVWLIATLKFSWLFLLFGFFVAKKQWFFKAWLLFFGIIAFSATRIALFFALPAAIFSGIGFNFFQSKTKEISLVFFLMIFFLALLNCVPETVNSKHYLLDSEKAGMLWLKQNSPADANIASEWDQGDPLAAVTNRAVLMDGHFEFNPIVAQRQKDIRTIMNSENCTETQLALEKYNTNFFFVDHESLFVKFDCTFANKVFDSQDASVFAFS